MNENKSEVRSVEDYKKISTISKIVGALVQAETNSLEAIKILEEAKNTFLERSWHIASNKKAD